MNYKLWFWRIANCLRDSQWRV